MFLNYLEKDLNEIYLKQIDKGDFDNQSVGKRLFFHGKSSTNFSNKYAQK